MATDIREVPIGCHWQSLCDGEVAAAVATGVLTSIVNVVRASVEMILV